MNCYLIVSKIDAIKSDCCYLAFIFLTYMVCTVFSKQYYVLVQYTVIIKTLLSSNNGTQFYFFGLLRLQNPFQQLPSGTYKNMGQPK